MSFSRTTAILLFIGAACLAGAWMYFTREPVPLAQRPAREVIGPMTLGWFSPPGDVFRRLGAPEKTGLVSPIKRVGPDGPMPEIVSGSLESLASAAVVMAHYRAACLHLGLDSPPAADILEVQPELTCYGQYGGQTISVIVTPRCDGQCLILIEVRGQVS
ncbi:hypothetical protein BON30_12285 [Cystobacter ferrugineus]|uniref:Uncharacterized protein n=2 Tax=Cystobacter ferrugineus TaxID=83449 RepID=A0A1L9BCA2_9BACT|nr:hypothetical protein BON30_12285 [Cystobacter ferrugineus]